MILNQSFFEYKFVLPVLKHSYLGNTRAVVAKNISTGLAETISYTDYYPHGGTLPGRNYVNSLGVPYAYQGIEKDAETNLFNFELRQYDARLGRWYNPDPMGQHHSPYLAMGNNPISMIDPDGGWNVPSLIPVTNTEGAGDRPNTYADGDDAHRDNMFNSGGGHSFMNGDMDRGINEQQAMGLLKHEYNEDRAKYYNSKLGEWGSWKTIRPLMGDASTTFVVDPSQKRDRPTFSNHAMTGGAANFGALKVQKLSYDNSPWYRTRIDVWGSNALRSGWNNIVGMSEAVASMFSSNGRQDVGNSIDNGLINSLAWLVGTDSDQKVEDFQNNGVGISEDIAGSFLLGRSFKLELNPSMSLKNAFGPIKQWIRVGPSYSHSLGKKTSLSIRWGASPANNGKYLKQIGNMSLREFNQYLRNKKLPGNNWRVKDSGHFHLKM